MNLKRQTILLAGGGFGLTAMLANKLSALGGDVVVDEGHRKVPLIPERGYSLRNPGVQVARQSSDPAVREWNARVEAKRRARKGR